jgi:hypothetical protein
MFISVILILEDINYIFITFRSELFKNRLCISAKIKTRIDFD